jgi:hypothetical protein
MTEKSETPVNLIPLKNPHRTDVHPGWIVAIHTKPFPGSLICHVGMVQSVTDRGIRITYVDWLIGNFTGMDCWIPWNQINEITVATDNHYIKGHDWGAEQTRARRAYESPADATAESVGEALLKKEGTQ